MGTVETPAFMPVGTHGAVKAMTPDQVRVITLNDDAALINYAKPIVAELRERRRDAGPTVGHASAA